MDEIIKAKADDWKYGDGFSKNCVIDGELTVTITLAEYRYLVTRSAEYDALRNRIYNMEVEMSKLKAEGKKC